MRTPAWANTARTGPVRKYQNLVVFACEGLLAVIDERDGKTEGEYIVVTPADMEERVRALARMYRGETRSMLLRRQREQHDAEKSGNQAMMECVKEARAMGDPSDPAVQAWWSRHRRTSAVACNFSAGANHTGYPTLPEIELGRRTGRTASIDGEVVVTPLLQHSHHLHRKPKKRSRSTIILD